MTPVYIVKTKHSDRVLKAFIDFRYRINKPKSGFRALVFSILFFLLAIAFRGRAAMYPFMVIGIIFVALLIARKSIAFGRLAKNDPNYQNQSEIVLTFGHSEFYVNNKELKDEEHYKYGEVSFAYEDDDFYYVSINNEDLQILPKSDFTTGDAKQFAQFISDKIGQPVRKTKLPFKEKMKYMRENSYRGQLEKKWEEEAKKKEESQEEE